MASKKVLIVTDDAGESFEILYAQHRFREAGYQPVVAATEKKLLNAVIHDFQPGLEHVHRKARLPDRE